MLIDTAILLWEAAVGLGWVFAMAAYICVFFFAFIL